MVVSATRTVVVRQHYRSVESHVLFLVAVLQVKQLG